MLQHFQLLVPLLVPKLIKFLTLVSLLELIMPFIIMTLRLILLVLLSTLLILSLLQLGLILHSLPISHLLLVILLSTCIILLTKLIPIFSILLFIPIKSFGSIKRVLLFFLMLILPPPMLKTSQFKHLLSQALVEHLSLVLAESMDNIMILSPTLLQPFHFLKLWEPLSFMESQLLPLSLPEESQSIIWHKLQLISPSHHGLLPHKVLFQYLINTLSELEYWLHIWLLQQSLTPMESLIGSELEFYKEEVENCILLGNM